MENKESLLNHVGQFMKNNLTEEDMAKLTTNSYLSVYDLINGHNKIKEKPGNYIFFYLL